MTIDLIQHDKQQRQMALDPTQSFIVQAPAGSGKTELLIQRFLTLLNHVQSPEEILAITFTKKAANEMRMRVMKALMQAAHEPEPDSAHAKQTWLLAKNVLRKDHELNWQLLSNPNQLRIQTIDSLCAYLTRQLPMLSHVGSQPDISDNPVHLYREAVQEVLMHVEENHAWSQAISHLLLHLDNDLNKLHDLLIHLLAKRDQWLSYIHFSADNDEIHALLEDHIAFVIEDCLHALQDIFPKDLADELISIANFLSVTGSPEQTRSVCSGVVVSREVNPGANAARLFRATFPPCNTSGLSAWKNLAKLLLTDKRQWRQKWDAKQGFIAEKNLQNSSEKALQKEYRERLKVLVEKLSEREDLRAGLSELFDLPNPHYQPTQRAILQSLLTVLKIIAAQLRIVFQQRGKIDFIENTQAALSALGTEEHPTDLTLALDYRIQHILVDEFQDTSYTQYQLLEKLIAGWEAQDGRSLFVVGDPMQSIYRFREAEVGLFIRMTKNGIGQIKLKPLRLTLNFRSAQPIVEWNNLHFKQIFPVFTDMATGAVTFSSSASPHESLSDSPETFIKISGHTNESEFSQTEVIIKTITENQKNYPADSLAILVRSRSHLSDIIPALKQAKIPYRAVDIDPLASKQCIQDLLSLTCALLHPADRIAWLSILRAPWCGLSLADLHVIAGEQPSTTIIDRLKNAEIMQLLSQEGHERLARIAPILMTQLAERDRGAMRDWIEKTWLQLGGPACLQNETDVDDVEAFFNLLTEMSAQHQVIHIDQLKEKMTQLYAASQHDKSSVQIMTIHSAKGLEFDSVILPHLGRKMPHDEKQLLLWMEQPLANDKMALLLAPIHATGAESDSVYNYIHHQQKLKSNYETDRLFYVAATRAKKRLHLFFAAEMKEDGELKVESGSFLAKLWPIIKNQNVSFPPKVETIEMDSRLRGNDTVRKTQSRLPIHWNNPIQTINTESTTLHYRKDGFRLPDESYKQIGTVVHRFLQQLSQRGIEWWQTLRKDQHEMLIRQQLTLLGMQTACMKPSIQSVLKALSNTINDEKGRWILKFHTDAKSEFAISAVFDDKVENLIIDRTFVDENGTRWIIDYKTSEADDANLEKFLGDEMKKYREQLQKYADAMQMLDPRPIKLGLYFPILPAWRES